MKKIITTLCLLLSISLNSKAQRLQPLSSELAQVSPTNIFPSDSDKAFSFSDKNKTVQSSFTADKKNDQSFFVAETFAPSSSHFNVQVTFKSTAPVKRGDMVLARFAIRSVFAKQESGDAVVYFFINQAVAPFERNILVDLSIGPEWKTIEIPFRAQHDMAAGEGTIGFTFGALVQKVELASVEVLNFENKTTLEKLPLTRFTYQGREENAAWRSAALQRIEEIRTAPLKIKIVNAKGKPVKGATVQATLVEQAFIWGTAVNEAVLGNELPNSANYKKYLKEFFNTAVIENGFKAAVWQGKPERKAETMRAFEWLEQNGFRQRGHNAVWPGWKFNTSLFRNTAETDTAKFRLMIEEDMRSKMLALKGRVLAWDVINEPLHERHFQKHLPAGIEVEWFKLAKQLDPQAQLFINEYAMLNSIYSPAFIKGYVDSIVAYRKAGAPIEGIGVQGHVGRQPRNPLQVLSDLDLFISTGLPVQITEFDINSPDEELQADYTRDFLIACYSHPVVTGFIKWGFWQSAHWKPDAAMFRKDWTEKPNAAVWREWVTKRWKTNVTATSNRKGEVNSRGHFGKYEVTITKGNKKSKVIYQLAKNSLPLDVTIE